MPTRTRNHNGYFLSWDGEGILFNPGDGTQRQMAHAGVAASDITRICLTHFHGDHCLGVPGVIQRLARDRAPHPVRPSSRPTGEVYFDRLRHAGTFYDAADSAEEPVEGTAIGGVTERAGP